MTSAVANLRAGHCLDDEVNDRFAQLLPRLRAIAAYMFRFRNRTEWEELIAEVVANAFVAFCLLANRGKIELAYAKPLAMYAVRQIREGRRVGGRLNVHDVTSTYCQRRHGINVVFLHELDSPRDAWRELLIEDRHATPADLVATRVDFADWLEQLPRKKRKLAEFLAAGEPTAHAADRFGVTPSRVSQLRREFEANWQEFQGEVAGDGAAAA